jgi:predicted transcriptional regulator
MNVLLSIKPEFSEKILSGEKRYEFRRTKFSEPSNVETIYLYATSPVQQIVGSFTAGEVEEGSPETLWSKYGDHSGIKDQSRFMEYFSGSETGYAIEIEETTCLSPPVDPRSFIENFRPPVSFQYVNGEYDNLKSQNPIQGSD